jgi:MarR family transcriptional regulator, lower aerobic nicotinate degradation pathway regulator
MYSLYRDLISLTEEFEQDFPAEERNLGNFSAWLSQRIQANYEKDPEPDWEGKSNGRSAESIINTSLIHLYRYAKVYGKLAIAESPFSTIDDIVFLLNLLHLGSMTKTKLIEINVHEKSTGIQIINRLSAGGFVKEVINSKDRRSRDISITDKGKEMLELHMDKVRKASTIVVGDLTSREKSQLIRLLQKLEAFHKIKIKDYLP